MTVFRLAAYAPNGAPLGYLPAPLSSSLSLPFNDVGALQFAYATTGPLSSLLGQPMEVVAEVSNDDGATWWEPRNGRYLYLQDGRDPIEDDNWTAACPGYGRRLAKARVGATGLNGSGQREFIDATPGAIMAALWGEAQARGALAGMAVWGASPTEDGAAQPWPTTYTVSYAPGTDLLTVLQAMADNGWVDYRFNGRDLEMYVPDTVMGEDLAVGPDPVILQPGLDITQGPFRRTWEALADTAYVLGDDLTWVEVSNPGALKPWGRQESFSQAGGVSDLGTLTTIGNRALAQSAAERTEHTFTIKDGTRWEALADYAPGDWVLVGHTSTEQPERMRVRQVTLSQSGEQFSGNLVANDRFLEADIRNARDIARLQNSGTQATTGTPSTGVGADILRPGQVVNIDGTSTAYVAQGITRTSIALDWPDVLTNIDGTSATDIQFYEVWRRRQGESTWQMLGETSESRWVIDGLEPGETWEFRIRAVDTVFNRGDFSAPYAITTASDTEAPPVPSAPLLTTVDGVIQAVWDGETIAGNPMATPDLKWLEVHASLEADFAALQGANGPGTTWKSVITLEGFSGRSLLEGWPRGQEVYVTFIAVDTSGNASAQGPMSSIVVDIPTDGQEPTVPVGWEPTLEPLGVGALVGRWTPIANQDAISYRAWVDTQTPVRKDAAHYVGEGADSVAVALLDGAPLEADTDYWLAVEPYDPDGPAVTVETPTPARIRLAGTDLISADYVYAGTISASQIESGQLTAAVALLGSISTASSGRTITMSSDQGLKGVDGSGNTVFHFPTDLTQGATLQADLTANSIDAVGKVSLRSNANEVRAGAKVILQKGTTPPVSAPTVVNEWTVLDADMLGGAPSVYDSGSFDPAQNLVYMGYVSNGQPGVNIFDADTGAFVTGFNPGLPSGITNVVGCSVSVIGANLYVLLQQFSPSNEVRLRCINKTTWALQWEVTKDSYGTTAVMGTDGTDLYTVYCLSDGQAPTPGQLRLQKVSPTTGSTVSTIDLAGQFAGVAYGGRAVGAVTVTSADFGAKRVLMTSRSQPGTVFAFDVATGARQSQHEFPTAYGEDMAAVWWDSLDSVFKSNSRNSARLFKYDGIKWFTGSAQETWEASYTWYDGDTVGSTHETVQSPVAAYTQSKRAKVTITTPPIPDNGGTDDPDRARIYLGYAAGARTDQFLQVTTPVGQRTATLTTVTFSGTNPPAAGNFPDGTPARIETSAGSSYYVDGLGDGRFRTVRDDTSLGVSIWRGTNQGIPHNVWTRVYLNSVGLAAGNWAFDAGAGHVVVPRSGPYMVTGSCVWAWDGYGGRRDLQVTFYQQAQPNDRLYDSRHTHGDSLTVTRVAEPVYLNAGTIVFMEVNAFTAAGLTTNIIGNPVPRLSITPIFI